MVAVEEVFNVFGRDGILSYMQLVWTGWNPVLRGDRRWCIGPRPLTHRNLVQLGRLCEKKHDVTGSVC